MGWVILARGPIAAMAASEERPSWQQESQVKAPGQANSRPSIRFVTQWKVIRNDVDRRRPEQGRKIWKEFQRTNGWSAWNNADLG
jgi:hypothetical protein